jgi:hypothetical protein
MKDILKEVFKKVLIQLLIRVGEALFEWGLEKFLE